MNHSAGQSSMVRGQWVTDIFGALPTAIWLFKIGSPSDDFCVKLTNQLIISSNLSNLKCRASQTTDSLTGPITHCLMTLLDGVDSFYPGSRPQVQHDANNYCSRHWLVYSQWNAHHIDVSCPTILSPWHRAQMQILIFPVLIFGRCPPPRNL